MSVSTTDLSVRAVSDWQGPVIDCDVHANVPSLEVLFEYQDELWVQWARERGWRGTPGVRDAYPPNAPSTCRAEWRPTDGSLPATSYDQLKAHILDPWQPDHALLTCNYAVDSLRHPDWAAAIARAVNDYVIDQWLSKDPRLVASITVPARDPVAAAREIGRVGGHPQFVQVLMPVRSEVLYGNRIHHPVLQAMVDHDLVLGLHWGGTTQGAPSTSGFASWYAEEYAAEPQAYAAQILSLVAEGAFRKFPALRVAVLEGGFSWLPAWGWRMNKEWKGLRREIPWVDRPPMDIIRDHFRFSTAPSNAGPAAHTAKIIEWLGSEDLLMFGTDYPHQHLDNGADLLGVVPEPMKDKLMHATARDWYRLPGSTP